MITCYNLTRIVKKQLRLTEFEMKNLLHIQAKIWMKKKVQISNWESKHCDNYTTFHFSHLSRSLLENWIISIWWRAAAFSCWELTGMAKSINELYCILSSPTSLGMHVCMLNIWICIGIEHLLSELTVSQRCALNNNPADKWAGNRKWW